MSDSPGCKPDAVKVLPEARRIAAHRAARVIGESQKVREGLGGNIRKNTFPARVDTRPPAASDALLLFVVLGVRLHATEYSTEGTGMGETKDYRHYQDNRGQIGFDSAGHITVGIGNGVGFDLTNGHLTISTGSGFSIDTGM